MPELGVMVQTVLIGVQKKNCKQIKLIGLPYEPAVALEVVSETRGELLPIQHTHSFAVSLVDACLVLSEDLQHTRVAWQLVHLLLRADFRRQRYSELVWSCVAAVMQYK